METNGITFNIRHTTHKRTHGFDEPKCAYYTKGQKQVYVTPNFGTFLYFKPIAIPTLRDKKRAI